MTIRAVIWNVLQTLFFERNVHAFCVLPDSTGHTLDHEVERSFSWMLLIVRADAVDCKDFGVVADGGVSSVGGIVVLVLEFEDCVEITRTFGVLTAC